MTSGWVARRTPIDDFQATITDQEVILIAENLRWRVRGLDRNTLSGVMKVNLLVTSLRNDRFHVDCFDLYCLSSSATTV